MKLNALPRDTRDTLFMLCVIACVVLPLLREIAPWCAVLTVLLLCWRAALAWQHRALPGKWWRLALLASALAATLWTYKTFFGRDPGVTLVVLLLALKTLELRASRDAFVVFFLSFFLLLSNFFYSQSLLTAAVMLVALLGLLTALVNAHMPVGRPKLWLAARCAVAMMLLGAPVMLGLFLLFPRLAPLWGLPADAMIGRSGLSDQLRVGHIAALALDDSVAMRVKFASTTPALQQLYFRGPVLASFDGQRWQPISAHASDAAPMLRVQGSAIRYQTTLEPNGQPWLLTLDAAAGAPELMRLRARLTPELQWVANAPVQELLRYQASSYTQFGYGPLSFNASLLSYLALPAGFNPRTLALAQAWQRQRTGAGMDTLPDHPDAAVGAKWVKRVLEKLRTQGYSYTLEPGIYGRHSADEFWFDRKAGFCEHIASSFVILLRALGVPARIVTGYQGGERNALDGFWTVRQSDAHAWAEVWLAGQGWVRVDPTSAVAPARITSMARLHASAGVMVQALLGTMNTQLAQNLRAAWDALNNRWNQSVLNYNQNQQFNLLKDIGFSSPSQQDLIYLLSALVLAASFFAIVLPRWKRPRRDPWLHLLARVQRRLQAAGIASSAHSTPRELAQQLAHQSEALGLCGPAWQAWLLRLEAVRYAPSHPGDAGLSAQLATLSEELTRLDDSG